MTVRMAIIKKRVGEYWFLTCVKLGKNPVCSWNQLSNSWFSSFACKQHS